jgi:hypothetical protein
MVREVVEEDVFVVVLRPHADRDEEATRRNIICDLCVNFFFFFFLVPTLARALVVASKTCRDERESWRERERERISLRISHITRSTVTVGRLFPFLISFPHAIKIIIRNVVTRRYTTARALLYFLIPRCCCCYC